MRADNPLRRFRYSNSPVANNHYAIEWGTLIANRVRAQYGHEVLRIILALGWRLVFDLHDRAPFPGQRLAAWEGDRRTIRVFVDNLPTQFPDFSAAVAFVCAHELFHGLAACQYRDLHAPPSPLPSLSLWQEEIAANAFAVELSGNFCLTFDPDVFTFLELSSESSA